MDLHIVNIVGGGELDIQIDLHSLSKSLPDELNMEYEPEISSGLKIQLDNPEVTIMLFSSGAFHLTGADSIESLGSAVDMLADTLLEEGFEISERVEVETRNMVFTGDFDLEFDLEKLANNITDYDYDPEVHAGLYYSKDGPLITVYRTGKFTVTGVTSEKEAEDLVEEFRSNIFT